MPPMEFVPSNPGPLTPESRIIAKINSLFQARARVNGVDLPINALQTDVWLAYVIPGIERLYGAKVYTKYPPNYASTLQVKFDRALAKVEELCSLFGSSPEDIAEILREVAPAP